MKRVVWECDRCGHPVDEASVFRLMVGSGANTETEYAEECERDYCKECMDAIIGFAHLPVKEAEEQPELKRIIPAPKKKPATKKSTATGNRGQKIELDDGMIVALKNTGWTYEKIADEIQHRYHLDVSPQTVCNHYKAAITKTQDKSQEDED